MARHVRRFDVYWIDLSPTVGTEIQKVRPCVVVSPDYVNTGTKVVVVPMTSKRKTLPTRIPIVFSGIEGDIALEHIRSIDKTRLMQQLDCLDVDTGNNILQALQKFFTP